MKMILRSDSYPPGPPQPRRRLSKLGFQTHMPAVAEAGETKLLVRRSVGAALATHIFRGYN
jgi:hypothetical protein